MMPLGPLPSPGPFGRIVDMRLWPHGFTTRQAAASGASPAGSAIVRPNLEDAAWHAAGSQKWGGNIVWTGSTPRHTIAYNGPRGRWWGAVKVYDGSKVQRPFQPWFTYNGNQVGMPGSRRVLGACMRVFDELPTTLSYTGAGNGTLTVQSPPTAPGVLTGDYEVRCIETGATPRFLVTAPDATPIGVAEAGPVGGGPVLFDSVVRFTLQSGAVPFVVGDAWMLTVEEAEQFIVLAQAMSGPTNGQDNAAADEVYRRGVSPGGLWTLLASIPAQPDEYFPVPQPWFINASGTRAVTTRTVFDPGNSRSGLVRLVDMDLRTCAVTRDDQGVNTFSWTAHVQATPAEPPPPFDGSGSYFGSSTKSLSTLSATLWRDWSGDVLITCREEAQFRYSHDWDGETGSGVYLHAAGSRYQSSELVIDHPGGEWHRTVHEDTTTASFDWYASDLVSARTVILRPIHGLSIYGAGVDVFFESDGQWDYSGEDGGPGGGLEIVTTSERTTVLARGGVIAERTGGGQYATNPSGTTMQQAVWEAFNYQNGMQVFTIHTNGDEASADNAEAAGGGPRIGYDTGAIISILGVPLMFTTGAVGGQVNNRLPAVIGGTFATDTRANYLQVVEVPQISGGFQHQGLFPMAAGNDRVAGSIGSGTYLIQSGGPDNLTPSQVHTLTGHPGADIWGIGAF